MVEDIKMVIKEYIKIDDELSEINKQAKEIRKSKTELESHIKDFMLNNDIAKVDMEALGVLRISKTKPNKKINKNIILGVLLDSLDEDKAGKIIEDIFEDSSEIEEVTKLERTKKKN